MDLFVLAVVCGPGAHGIANLAQAYIDPGAGSMLLQLLLGGLAGLYVFAKLFKQKVLELLGFKKSDNNL
jgi:hypothetical protein